MEIDANSDQEIQNPIENENDQQLLEDDGHANSSEDGMMTSKNLTRIPRRKFGTWMRIWVGLTTASRRGRGMWRFASTVRSVRPRMVQMMEKGPCTVDTLLATREMFISCNFIIFAKLRVSVTPASTIIMARRSPREFYFQTRPD
eukprot:c19664_g1_i2.p2 GENE.c19664_g1_i2~~c19664_g1_i2.p2  ORF type:complete len:145 (+),score=21.98 c19664_g1_i2:1083-1517(+)